MSYFVIAVVAGVRGWSIFLLVYGPWLALATQQNDREAETQDWASEKNDREAEAHDLASRKNYREDMAYRKSLFADAGGARMLQVRRLRVCGSFLQVALGVLGVEARLTSMSQKVTVNETGASASLSQVVQHAYDLGEALCQAQLAPAPGGDAAASSEPSMISAGPGLLLDGICPDGTDLPTVSVGTCLRSFALQSLGLEHLEPIPILIPLSTLPVPLLDPPEPVAGVRVFVHTLLGLKLETVPPWIEAKRGLGPGLLGSPLSSPADLVAVTSITAVLLLSQEALTKPYNGGLPAAIPVLADHPRGPGRRAAAGPLLRPRSDSEAEFEFEFESSYRPSTSTLTVSVSLIMSSIDVNLIQDA